MYRRKKTARQSTSTLDTYIYIHVMIVITRRRGDRADCGKPTTSLFFFLLFSSFLLLFHQILSISLSLSLWILTVFCSSPLKNLNLIALLVGAHNHTSILHCIRSERIGEPQLYLRLDFLVYHLAQVRRSNLHYFFCLSSKNFWVFSLFEIGIDLGVWRICVVELKIMICV